MSRLPPKETFDILNASYHVIYEYKLFTNPIYEYWDLDGLLSTMEDSIPKQSFKGQDKIEQIIRKSTPRQIYSRKPERLDQLVLNTLPPDNDIDAIPRYAAWALFKYIGDRTILQQEYFLTPTETLDTIKRHANISLRIPQRDFVAKQEAYFSGILGHFNRTVKSKDGFNNRNGFKYLRHEINDILYGSQTSTNDIRNDYNIPPKIPLADYMNSQLLYAYGMMLKQIVNEYTEYLLQTSHDNYGVLHDITISSAINTRINFKMRYGLPSDNFSVCPISKIKQLHNQREIEFAKKWIKTH